MAFEGILDLDRGAGYTRPSRFRRVMLTVSLAVHAVALIAGVAWSFWQVDELSMPQVAVTLTATAAPPPPPPPPPASHHSSTKPKTKPVRKIETLVQPQERPKEQPKPKEEEQDEPDQPGGVEGGVKGGVQGGVVGGVVGAPVANDAPRILPPAVGKQLLLTDPDDERYRVKLPEVMERAGIVAKAIVRICVSAQGTVTDVKVLKGAGPAIDPQIPGVLRTWKYKPYTLDGKPTPFCFPFVYQISAR